ncbi:thioredoxin family protein [Dyella sp. LX-66]|uniref:DUF899 domain-containing protein n=1 Tax=unclassified Dyella TaxID=2634549 RepID=UPI001BE022F9|nr:MULTISPECIES: thioredoxin family protein [unclassified Dyella]MBT2116089.1 thioredoxin family protein [Dyella sp. LX-1]MBT2138099.1 thioredoxin family protein [Dyella sp. LX-66]
MDHQTVSRDAWIEARVALLEKEKEFTRLKDELSAARRELPWVEVTEPYVFDGPQGPVTLAELFGGRSQLFVKHFMLRPGQEKPCIGCSFEVDHLAGILVHLENHDVAYVAIARAPIAEIEALRQRMGWQFPFVSSHRSDFNFDFQVSFTPEQMAEGKAIYNYREEKPEGTDYSGDSVFYKDADGRIFHTYSTFGRGGEQFLGIYGFLDVMPKGRAENGPYRSLGDWVKLRDAYGTAAGCGCKT